MREIPMLFSTPMVQALLNGTKNQTRRIIKPQPDCDGLWNDTDYPRSLQSTLKGWNGTIDETGESKEWRQVTPGDIIWVKETFTKAHKNCWDAPKILSTIEPDMAYYFKAGWERSEPKWSSPLFMPKSVARIRLEVTDVKVERLFDISEQDAENEGLIRGVLDGEDWGWRNYMHGFGSGQPFQSAQESYFSLWDSINGKDAHNLNPWVWVIKFKIIKQ